ncbi:MAG: DinB family protein [Melioribacteraceae bacterium]
MKRPGKSEYAAYYHTYVEAVPEGEIIKIMKKQCDQIKKLLGTVSKKDSLFRYAPGKWCVREVVGHIIDTERVFAYRTLRFARNDKNDLPGFDENEYIHQSNYCDVGLDELIEEFCTLRYSNIIMFKNFSEEFTLRKGTANGNSFTVRAMAYIMCGHVNHHLKVLKEKYLV